MTDDEIKAARVLCEPSGLRMIEANGILVNTRRALTNALDEVKRLRACLTKANDNHEKFERQWYLVQDELERLRPVYEAAKACPFTSADGWLMCQLKMSHGGACDMKDISLAKEPRSI